jgi:hypothetical protein
MEMFERMPARERIENIEDQGRAADTLAGGVVLDHQPGGRPVAHQMR